MSDSHGRDTNVLAAQLRAWIREHDLRVGAAVKLLIEHGGWRRRADVTLASIGRHGREARIDRAVARLHAGCCTGGSVGALAIFALAVAFGENRCGLSIMDPANAAVARAVGADG